MKYRQIAHRLRLQMGPGKPDVESERPREKRSGRYTDFDAAGQITTLIEIPAKHPQLAVLLRNGAIEPLTADPAREGAASG